MLSARTTTLFVFVLFIRTVSSSAQDSTRYLKEITIQAYNSKRPLSEVSASVSQLNSLQLSRFSNTSLLPAVNTLPGVRMEERSPGSYRFSIRGSLLRSPFGVRNVKFYWNALPITDGGGNTYLNLFDFNSLSALEIIKGPGASLYGAGTGGVVLLSPPTFENQKVADVSLQVGSYGLFRSRVSANLVASPKNQLSAHASFQKSDGYREQTAMERITAGLDWNYFISPNSSLTTSFFTSQLFYETPGGLTKIQFEQDPTQARPAGGPNPGAVEQQASVTNATHFLSSQYEVVWNNLTFDAGVIASLTDFTNPAIRNLEKREEGNLGGRTSLEYKQTMGAITSKFTVGAELQYFYSPVDVYENVQGKAGALQFQDELWSTNQLYFAQAEFDLPKQFYLTLGGSTNSLQYKFERAYPQPTATQTKTFDLNFYPRLALVKKVTESLSLFSSISKGFSPPSLAEVRPSTNTFNSSLQAESGRNIEMGIRGKALSNKLNYELTLYDFQLEETIVLQRAEDGADYFVNAGETSQQGLEASLAWTNRLTNRSTLSVWMAYSLNDYYFEEYVQDGNDYSGNRLTGVAPNVASLGLDFAQENGFYLNSTLQYTDHIPLNDANTEFASYYWLVGARLGYKRKLPTIEIDAFAGIDNALNERYSLGNDINAFGGRYYNAGPTRNYYLGLSAKLNKKN